MGDQRVDFIHQVTVSENDTPIEWTRKHFSTCQIIDRLFPNKVVNRFPIRFNVLINRFAERPHVCTVFEQFVELWAFVKCAQPTPSHWARRKEEWKWDRRHAILWWPASDPNRMHSFHVPSHEGQDVRPRKTSHSERFPAEERTTWSSQSINQKSLISEIFMKKELIMSDLPSMMKPMLVIENSSVTTPLVMIPCVKVAFRRESSW